MIGRTRATNSRRDEPFRAQELYNQGAKCKSQTKIGFVPLRRSEEWAREDVWRIREVEYNNNNNNNTIKAPNTHINVPRKVHLEHPSHQGADGHECSSKDEDKSARSPGSNDREAW